MNVKSLSLTGAAAEQLLESCFLFKFSLFMRRHCCPCQYCSDFATRNITKLAWFPKLICKLSSIQTSGNLSKVWARTHKCITHICPLSSAVVRLSCRALLHKLRILKHDYKRHQTQGENNKRHAVVGWKLLRRAELNARLTYPFDAKTVAK